MGGKNIAYATVHTKKDGYFLESIKVAPGHRNKGIGKQLLQRVIEQHGDKPINTLARPFGQQSLDKAQLVEFYQKHGFEKLGDRNNGVHMQRKPTRRQDSHESKISGFSNWKKRFVEPKLGISPSPSLWSKHREISLDSADRHSPRSRSAADTGSTGLVSVSAAEREDSGYEKKRIWVKNSSVDGGGYWQVRRVKTEQAKSSTHNKAVAAGAIALVGGAAIAAGAVALSKSKQSNPSGQQNETATSSATNQWKKYAVAGAGVAGAGAVAAGAIATRRKQQQATPEAPDPTFVPDKYAFNLNQATVYAVDAPVVGEHSANKEARSLELDYYDKESKQVVHRTTASGYATINGEKRGILKAKVETPERDHANRQLRYIMAYTLPPGVSVDGVPDDWAQQIYESSDLKGNARRFYMAARFAEDEANPEADALVEKIKSTTVDIPNNRSSKPQQQSEESDHSNHPTPPAKLIDEQEFLPPLDTPVDTSLKSKAADGFPSPDEIQQNLKPLQKGAATPSGYDLFTAEVSGKQYFVKQQPAIFSEREETAYKMAEIYGVQDFVLPAKRMELNGKTHIVSPFLNGSPMALTKDHAKRLDAIDDRLYDIDADREKLDAAKDAGHFSEDEWKLKRRALRAEEQQLKQEAHDLNYASTEDMQRSLQSVGNANLKKLVLYDYALNISDRHTMNVYKTDDGLKLIDNALTLHDAGERRGSVEVKSESPSGMKLSTIFSIPPSTKLPRDNALLEYGGLENEHFTPSEIQAVLAKSSQVEALINRQFADMPDQRKMALSGFRKRMNYLKQMMKSENLAVKELQE